MKTNRLFALFILASSIVLTSCEGILTPRRKNSFSSGTSYEGYQGKAGLTKLDEEEWNLAFSLEDQALRRNFRYTVSTSGNSQTNLFDAGKIKLGENEIDNPHYYEFKEVRGNTIAGTYSYYDSNGNVVNRYDEEPLDLTMAQFGILAYDYNDFTYDTSSKTYQSDGFKYEIFYNGYAAVSLNCTNVAVCIENGLPSYVWFNYTQGDSDKVYLFRGEYDLYNKVKVEIPTESREPRDDGGDSFTYLEKPIGEKIYYPDFLNACRNKPSINYTYLEVIDEVYSRNGLVKDTTFSCNYVDGEWLYTSGAAGFDISIYIFTEDYLTSYYENIPDDHEVEFYHNSGPYDYAISIRYNYDGDDVAANIYLDQFFYVVQEEILQYQELEVRTLSWS